MYIERVLVKQVRSLALATPAIVLTGARQTGKTTLLRAAFPSYHYVSLDLPSTAERAEKDPGAFLRDHPPPCIVDEVQYAPGLFRHLKVAIDQDRHAHGRFILTGSQKFPLMKEVADSLAGRCVWLELEGFSLAEIRRAQPEREDLLEEALMTGSFPELWTNPLLPRADYFASYLATYLERDVRQLINVASLRDFERFVRACAARNGQLLDKSALARDVGISAKTATAWLSVLTASNQLSLLEPWFANLGKRLVKSPKLYFCDVGLCAFLLGVTKDTLRTSPYLGSLWETLVYAEIRKALMLRSKPLTSWYYRDDRQLEVDFLLVGGGHANIIEAKWTELPSTGDARAVREVMALAGRTRDMSTASGWLVCRTAETFPIPGEGPRVDAVDLDRLVELLH